MRITCDTKDTLPLSELTEFQGGLKKRTDDDIAKIERSIEQYGFATPFFVWKHNGKNKVLDGHGRLQTLKAMQAIGEMIAELPVVYIDLPNEEAAKNLLLRICSTYGEMTAESVADFLDGLKVNLDDIKLPDGLLDLNICIDPLATHNDDEVPEIKEYANSQYGELYELGSSILMCGDSKKEEDVSRLMRGLDADLLLTDPPYNVDYKGGTKQELKIQNDNMSDTQFRLFLTDCFTVLKNHIKEGAAFYIWHADLEGYNFRGACRDSGLIIKQCLVWNKNSLVLGRNNYQWKHEPCLYGWKNGGHSWYADRKQTTVLNFDRPTANKEHPTMKPVELFEYLIKNSTKAGDVVLDGFGGSGTTLIACEKNKRKARLLELDPHYCDVIRRRWTKWAKENGYAVGTGGLE